MPRAADAVESRRAVRPCGTEAGGGQLAAPRSSPCAASAQPHSLNPHTWHFTQPSANSSWLPQSGHVPMNTSPEW